MESQLFSNDKTVFLSTLRPEISHGSAVLSEGLPVASGCWSWAGAENPQGRWRPLSGRGHREKASAVNALGHGRAPGVGLRDCSSVSQGVKLKPEPGSHCGVELTRQPGLLSKKGPREARGGVVCWLWNECRECGGAQVLFCLLFMLYWGIVDLNVFKISDFMGRLGFK